MSNVTIRADEESIKRWKGCAEAMDQSLNAWIIKTLEKETAEMEDTFIVRHVETHLGLSIWDVQKADGGQEGSVKVKFNTSFGTKNVTVTIYDNNNVVVGSKKATIGTMSKRELGESIVDVLRSGLPGAHFKLEL